nr:hypothetical protein DBT41_16145 [Aerococcus urinae]
METFIDVIDAWPTLGDFAEDAGVSSGAAKQMRRRDSIDPAYWEGVVAGAEKRHIEGVSLDQLARIAAARKRRQAVSEGADG